MKGQNAELVGIGIYPSQQHEAERVSKAKVDEIVQAGTGAAWGVYDSALTGDPSSYVDTSFNKAFYGVVGHEASSLDEEELINSESKSQGLKREIEALLDAKRGDAVGLEIGGPGIRLFGEFSPGFFRESYGAGLNPLNSGVAKANSGSHSIIGEVNAFTSEGIEAIRQSLPGGRADLIIERMGLPLYETMHANYPKNLFSLLRIADEWYRLLEEGGVMYAQIPLPLFKTIIASDYKNWLNKTYADRLHIEVASDGGATFTIRLIKMTGAPERLPVRGILEYIHAQEAKVIP